MSAHAVIALLFALGNAPTVDPASVREGTFYRKVVTSDGVALALYRYVPNGGGRQRPPVLLLPELGMGRSAYDLGGDGLARYLRTRGFDVFVAEVRGQGRAAGREGTLAEIVSTDLPAIFAAIERLRAEPINVVAHGYSGTLLLAATTEELRGKVGRVVALSTPVEPEVPNRLVEELLKNGGRLSEEALTPEGRARFDLIFAHGGGFSGSRLGELRLVGMSNLGTAVSSQLLTWMRQGDLSLSDGSSIRGRLTRYDRPTLLVLPLGDNFAHPEFASPLRDISQAPVAVRVLSRLEFLSEDYSHLSVIHGRDAERDVFAPMVDFFLDERIGASP